MSRTNPNVQWLLSKLPNVHECQTEVLMDIRDELQKLNSLLHCQNFINIPTKLDTIRRHTSRIPVPKRKVIK